jgi:hypothetical protein
MDLEDQLASLREAGDALRDLQTRETLATLARVRNEKQLRDAIEDPERYFERYRRHYEALYQFYGASMYRRVARRADRATVPMNITARGVSFLAPKTSRVLEESTGDYRHEVIAAQAHGASAATLRRLHARHWLGFIAALLRLLPAELVARLLNQR